MFFRRPPPVAPPPEPPKQRGLNLNDLSSLGTVVTYFVAALVVLAGATAGVAAGLGFLKHDDPQAAMATTTPPPPDTSSPTPTPSVKPSTPADAPYEPPPYDRAQQLIDEQRRKDEAAGAAWAEEHHITKESQCPQKKRDFTVGCYKYLAAIHYS